MNAVQNIFVSAPSLNSWTIPWYEYEIRLSGRSVMYMAIDIHASGLGHSLLIQSNHEI